MSAVADDETAGPQTLGQSATAGGRGRLGLGLLDQALSSLTNAGLGLAMARLVGPEELGAFGIAFAIYLIAIGAARAVGSDPYLGAYSQAGWAAKAERGREAISAALGLGLCGAILCVVLAAAFDSHLRSALLVLAVGAPALLAAEVVRHVALVQGRAWAAVALDLTWLVSVVAGVLTLVAVGQESLSTVLAVWCIGAAAGLAVGLRSMRAVVDLRSCGGWYRNHRAKIFGYLADFSLMFASTEAVLYLLMAGGDLGELGRLKAAHALIGPVYFGLIGLMTAGVPEMARRRSQDRSLLQQGAALSLAAVGVVVAWALLLTIGSDSVARALLGSNWRLANEYTSPVLVVALGTALSAGAIGTLRVRNDAARLARTRALVAGVTLSALALAAGFFSIKAAVWAMSGAGVVAAAYWWWVAVAAARWRPGSSRWRARPLPAQHHLVKTPPTLQGRPDTLRQKVRRDSSTGVPQGPWRE